MDAVGEPEVIEVNVEKPTLFLLTRYFRVAPA